MPQEKSFIEVQFPISKLSKESYKERKANATQTLTCLGKWWGRKPLALVRGAILGLLQPATDNPKKDRQVFLSLMTMDDAGMWQRKSKNIALATVFEKVDADVRRELFAAPGKFKKGITPEQREYAQRVAFDALSYDKKLEYCDRPEHATGPSPEAWTGINDHLSTNATNLNELVAELGRRRFGRVPKVGDVFCGGGSIPFEAARIGCEAYASDLNPVASLLTWGALNIVGGGADLAKEVAEAQTAVYEKVNRQIIDWGIEHNVKGWRADAYLYCFEARCPECGWMVPLAPSWVLGERTMTVAKLSPVRSKQVFSIEILSGVTVA